MGAEQGITEPGTAGGQVGIGETGAGTGEIGTGTEETGTEESGPPVELGTLLWNFTGEFTMAHWKSPVIADVDGDGRSESLCRI